MRVHEARNAKTSGGSSSSQEQQVDERVESGLADMPEQVDERASGEGTAAGEGVNEDAESETTNGVFSQSNPMRIQRVEPGHSTRTIL